MQVHTVPAKQPRSFFIQMTEQKVRAMRAQIIAAPPRQPLCICPRCTAMHAYTGLQQLVLL